MVALVLVGILGVSHLVYDPAVDRAVQAVNVTRLGHEAMLDQQDGLRGLLASGDERFLEAYEQGHAALPDLNQEASQLIAGRAYLGEYLLDMRLAQQAWLSGWATEALVTGREGTAPPESFALRDKRLFDEYRASYTILIGQLTDGLDQAVSDQRRAFLAAIALALLITAAAGTLGLHRNRALRREVGAPLRALMDRLEQIRSGDLAARAVPNGPSEFRTLHVGLEEAATTLGEAVKDASSQAERLSARGRRQAEVLGFTRTISGNLSLPYVLKGVCTHASAIADGARTIVWVMDSTRTHLEPYGDSSNPGMQPVGLESAMVGDGLVGSVGAFGRAQRLGSVAGAPVGRLAVPMVVSAQVIGVLEFVGAQVPALTEEAVEVLETMATHAASAIEAARVHADTTEMAMSDALTGLRNRRRLNDDLQEECEAGARYGRPLAVLMIDIDHFKNYNDTFGHQAGDVALRAVAETLADGLRATDHAYRYGGDEFVVVLRETTSADAGVFAERLRSAVEDRFGGPNELPPVTISLGAASMPEHGDTPGGLIAVADDALYKAKRSGRNQIASGLPRLPLPPRTLGC